MCVCVWRQEPPPGPSEWAEDLKIRSLSFFLQKDTRTHQEEENRRVVKKKPKPSVTTVRHPRKFRQHRETRSKFMLLGSTIFIWNKMQMQVKSYLSSCSSCGVRKSFLSIQTCIYIHILYVCVTTLADCGIRMSV